MSRHLLVEPTTDAQLFDMVHGLFGVGDYDDSNVDMPWFKFRMREITKLKALRKSRGISLKDMAIAARYCYRKRYPIHYMHQLTWHIALAKRELAKNRTSDLDQEVAAALNNERSRPDKDMDWERRLLLARGPARREVLDLWLQERGRG